MFGDPQGMAFFLPNGRLGATSELLVRKALNHAINKDAIIKTVYYNVHTPAYSPLAASSFGFNPNLKDLYPYDVNKAKQLLEQAGWTVGIGGVRQKGGQEMALSCVTSFRTTAES
ncbi:MAG: ABC transporter substrate-binding protein [Dehalococcoidia bacterium]